MTTYRITHKAGQCRSGIDNKGSISHAVVNNLALCGQTPGKKSSWSEYNDQSITCKKCLKIINNRIGECNHEKINQQKVATGKKSGKKIQSENCKAE